MYMRDQALHAEGLAATPSEEIGWPKRETSMQTLPPQPLLLLNSKHRCNMGMAGQTLVCLAILVPIFHKIAI